MAYLKITISATVALPKSAGGAVAETIRAHTAVQAACHALRNAVLPIYAEDVKIEQYADDAEPTPAAKPKRGRRPRAALGSSPLFAGTVTAAMVAAADGLAPEAGADSGPIPESLRRT